MNAISLSVAALIVVGLAAQNAKNALEGESFGPFAVSSVASHVEAFPYPYVRKTVTLAWKSSDGAATFALVDDGERLEANFKESYGGSFRCSISSNLTLNRPLKSYFSILRAGGCGNVGLARRTVLQGEFKEAGPYITAAFERFRAASKTFLGPSERRCVKYDFGNHGLICSKFSSERE